MARTRLALAALALALASPDTLASPQDRSAPIPDTNSVRATPAKSAGTYYAAAEKRLAPPFRTNCPVAA
ncbi:MAG: hypothetical protein AAFP22_10495, partial [Planctomycetota bacterium]